MSADVQRSTTGQGQQPADAPQVRWWAVLFGVVLVAVALVGVRELVAVWNPGSGWTPWLRTAPEFLATRSPEWMAVAGVVALVVGVLCLIAAVRPRKKRYLRVTVAEPSVWARPVDLARYSTAAAKRIPGVLAASSLARKGRVTVTAAVRSPDDTTDRNRIHAALRTDVQAAFGEHLDVKLLLREAGPDDGSGGGPPRTTAPELTTVIDPRAESAPGPEGPALDSPALEPSREVPDAEEPGRSGSTAVGPLSSAETMKMRRVDPAPPTGNDPEEDR